MNSVNWQKIERYTTKAGESFDIFIPVDNTGEVQLEPRWGTCFELVLLAKDNERYRQEFKVQISDGLRAQWRLIDNWSGPINLEKVKSVLQKLGLLYVKIELEKQGKKYTFQIPSGHSSGHSYEDYLKFLERELQNLGINHNKIGFI